MAATVAYAVILAAILAILAIAPDRADARSVDVSNGGPNIDVDVLVDGLSRSLGPRPLRQTTRCCSRSGRAY